MRARHRRPVMYFSGLDAHLRYVTVAVLDRLGGVALETTVPTREPDRLLAVLAPFRPLEVVVETCPFWPWLYDLLVPAGIGFHLAHAKALRAIATAPQKSDAVDARLLARMRRDDCSSRTIRTSRILRPPPARHRSVCECRATFPNAGRVRLLPDDFDHKIVEIVQFKFTGAPASWYLVATDDRMIPPVAQRFMSKRAGSTVRESPGSHAIYVSRSAPVVALIEQAARALETASR